MVAICIHLAWKPDGTLALAMLGGVIDMNNFAAAVERALHQIESNLLPRRCLEVVPCGLRVIRLNAEDSGD